MIKYLISLSRKLKLPDKFIQLSRVMRITVLLLVVGCVHLSANVLSQTVTLRVEKQSLTKVFEAIESQTGYQVVYSERFVKSKNPVSITANRMPLEKFLEAVLTPQTLSFKIKEKTVLIERLETIPVRREAIVPTVQQRIVTGRVTNEEGNSLEGVTISVKGTPVATLSDANGNYQLTLPANGTTLSFSTIGYALLEIEVPANNVVNVVLVAQVEDVEGVVVVAFGTQKKKEVVGAITTINPQEMNVPSSNLTTALAGRLAGVVAYQRSGEPGADDADFFIRGVTSFGYKRDPLILIDAIEVSSRELARMQVDDIANFSILKDAAATALYGARGANGVILINTKEGVEGKTLFNVRMENSLSMPTRNIELADPVTYMRLNNEAVRTRNALAPTPYFQSQIDNTIAGTDPYVYPATDWLDMLFKDYTMNQRFNLNASGGGKAARYYLAATLNRDNGMLKVDNRNNFNNNIDLKTYQLRSNINVNLTNTTEVGVKLYGSFDDYTGPMQDGAHYYRLAVRSDPVSFPAYYPTDDAHQHVNHILFGNTPENFVNPYAELVKGYREYNRSLMLAQFELKQDLDFIAEGLKLQGLFNISRHALSSISRSYNPYWYQVGSYDRFSRVYTLDAINEDTGTEYLSFNQAVPEVRSTTYIQATTNYNRTFNEKHQIGGLLVFLMQNEIQNWDVVSLQTSLPHRNIGVSGRFSYAYDDRYFGEFNFGYNGSERFFRNNRFGFFPSGGVAWQVSNEPFWEPFRSVINDFKIRGTYGVVGNDAIGSATDRFFYLSEVNMDDPSKRAVFGLENTYWRDGITVNRYSNPEITWEKSYKTNVGFDMSLFNKLNVITDFWKEQRNDILMERVSIPTTMGLTSEIPKANVGKAQGQGIDFSVDYSDYITPDFWIQGRANFTYAVSNFLAYEEPIYANEPWKSRVGYNLTQNWGYIAERLFIDDEEVYNSPTQNFGEAVRGGDIKYRDVNGDGRITELDQVPIGYPTSPEIVYGFGVSVGLKQFDFSMFFQGLARESFWLDLERTTPFVQSVSGGARLKNQMLNVYADDHWSEGNPDPYALWPRLSPGTNANNSQMSTWFMRDGSFMRLKNAEFGYTVPQRVSERIHIRKARVYLSGINLLSWSKFDLWDVEMAGNGLGYPIQRVFNLGVQVSF